jgi:hypothetical protein
MTDALTPTWLSTYYVTIKVAGGNFDHMATYFPLVMGDAPSLWLNNLRAGSITSWADLSQALTSNFQVTYNRPGNAFNLGRVTIKTGEQLWDYTNWFFKNRNTCVGVQDDQVVDSYKKGLTDCKVFEKSMSPVPPRSRHSWRSSTSSLTQRKRWSTSLTMTASRMQAPLVPLGIPA